MFVVCVRACVYFPASTSARSCRLEVVVVSPRRIVHCAQRLRCRGVRDGASWEGSRSRVRDVVRGFQGSKCFERGQHGSRHPARWSAPWLAAPRTMATSTPPSQPSVLQEMMRHPRAHGVEWRQRVWSKCADPSPRLPGSSKSLAVWIAQHEERVEQHAE